MIMVNYFSLALATCFQEFFNLNLWPKLTLWYWFNIEFIYYPYCGSNGTNIVSNFQFCGNHTGLSIFTWCVRVIFLLICYLLRGTSECFPSSGTSPLFGVVVSALASNSTCMYIPSGSNGYKYIPSLIQSSLVPIAGWIKESAVSTLVIGENFETDNVEKKSIQ